MVSWFYVWFKILLVSIWLDRSVCYYEFDQLPLLLLYKSLTSNILISMCNYAIIWFMKVELRPFRRHMSHDFLLFRDFSCNTHAANFMLPVPLLHHMKLHSPWNPLLHDAMLFFPLASNMKVEHSHFHFKFASRYERFPFQFLHVAIHVLTRQKIPYRKVMAKKRWFVFILSEEK